MNPETSLCWIPFSEALTSLRQRCLQEGLPPPHWDRVENCAGLGTPDLSWAWGKGREGHIELKYRAALPQDVGRTPVSLDTITPHQRLWWRSRWEAGGCCHVLLRLGERFMLFGGRWAALNLGRSLLEEMEAEAMLVLHRRELDAAVVLEACRWA